MKCGLSALFVLVAACLLVPAAAVPAAAVPAPPRKHEGIFASTNVKIIDKGEGSKLLAPLRKYFAQSGAYVSPRTSCRTAPAYYDVLLYIHPHPAGAGLGKNPSADRLSELKRAICIPEKYHYKTISVFDDSVAVLGGNPFIAPRSFVNLEAAFEYITNNSTGFRMDSIALPSKPKEIPSIIGASSVVIKDKVYLFGGYVGTPSEVHKSITVLDISSGAPTLFQSIPFPKDYPVTSQGVAGDNEKFIYVAGGRAVAACAASSATVYRYDTEAKMFLKLPDLPRALQGGGLVYTRSTDELHFIGGHRGYNRSQESPQSWHYILKKPLKFANNWKEEHAKWGWDVRSRFPGPPRMNHLAVSLTDAFGVENVYVIGGSLLTATGTDGNPCGANWAEEVTPTVYRFQNTPQSRWEEAMALPVAVAHISSLSVTVANGAGLLLFGGQTKVLPVLGVTRRLVFYTPSLDISRTVGYFPKGEEFTSLLAVREVVPAGSVESGGILLLGSTHQANQRSPSLIRYKVSLGLFHSDYFLGTVGTPSIATSFLSALNLKPGERPVYMILHTDGGITNLKMNIVGAAELAFQNDYILVLPDMATDWVASRKEELASNVSTLMVNKCGAEGVQCVPFGDVFDSSTFISVAKTYGLRVVRNTLPKTDILRHPSSVVDKNAKSGMYSSRMRSVSSTFALLAIKEHMCCHRFAGNYCPANDARAMGASFVLSGVANYWHMNFTTPAEKIRRDGFFFALQPTKIIRREIFKVMKSMMATYNRTEFAALHLRIEPEVQVHCRTPNYVDITDCYVAKEEVVRRLTAHIPEGSLVYVAIGNSPERDGALALLKQKYIVTSKEELSPKIHETLRDQRELLALVDQEMCLRSGMFVGSRPSSFSFLVAALRTKQNKPWAYYNDKTVLPGVLQTHSTDFVRNPAENFEATYSE